MILKPHSWSSIYAEKKCVCVCVCVCVLGHYKKSCHWLKKEGTDSFRQEDTAESQKFHFFVLLQL